jgi:hypothetical protein
MRLTIQAQAVSEAHTAVAQFIPTELMMRRALLTQDLPYKPLLTEKRLIRQLPQVAATLHAGHAYIMLKG